MVKKQQEMLNFTINDMQLKIMKLLFFTYQLGNCTKIHSIQYCQGCRKRGHSHMALSV